MILVSKKSFIFILFQRRKRERGAVGRRDQMSKRANERERNFPFVGSLFKCPNQLDLG